MACPSYLPVLMCTKQANVLAVQVQLPAQLPSCLVPILVLQQPGPPGSRSNRRGTARPGLHRDCVGTRFRRCLHRLLPPASRLPFSAIKP